MHFIPHHAVTPEQLQAIIALKDKVWPHGLANQLKWMESNINKTDIHGLYFYEQQLIAYINLVHRTAFINDVSMFFLGLGNVCVDPAFQGTGKGKEIMNFVNQYLTSQDVVGILLCKTSLVQFYSNCGWRSITNYVQSDLSAGVQVMIFNYKSKIYSIDIKGTNF